MDYYILSNGIKVPALGIGTYKLNKEDVREVINEALTLGYELIDTSESFGNEEEIGKVINDFKIDRSKLFISTKITNTDYNNSLVNDSLKRLNLNYIDLLTLDISLGNYINGYKMLEEAYKNNKIKSIGISNFTQDELDEILSITTIKPHIAQIELNPLCQQKEIRRKLLKEDIQVMSIYPLAHGDERLLNSDMLNEMSNTYYRTNAQLLIKWQLEHKFICMPGAHHKQFLEANLNSFNYNLKETDLEKIDKLDENLSLLTKES